MDIKFFTFPGNPGLPPGDAPEETPAGLEAKIRRNPDVGCPETFINFCRWLCEDCPHPVAIEATIRELVDNYGMCPDAFVWFGVIGQLNEDYIAPAYRGKRFVVDFQELQVTTSQSIVIAVYACFMQYGYVTGDCKSYLMELVSPWGAWTREDGTIKDGTPFSSKCDTEAAVANPSLHIFRANGVTAITPPR
jgi:hypothetical protein